jgi:hypothetical protein
MRGNGAATEEDKTNPLNKGNMLFPTSIDELPDELRQKLQAKIDADTKTFLESYTKNGHDKVTQFREPVYSDAKLPHLQAPRIRMAGKLCMMKRYIPMLILLMLTFPRC